MNIKILTEGGKGIGFGHVSRCLALMQTFESRGHKTELFVNGDRSVESILKGARFKITNWLSDNNVSDSTGNFDLVLIDSYLAQEDFYSDIVSLGKRAVFLDDNNRVSYSGGIVVNWGINSIKIGYPESNKTTYLLGPKYTALRKAFWHFPKKKIMKNIGSVMISFGGDDSKSLTPLVLGILAREFPFLKKNVVIGQAFDNREQIENVADNNTCLINEPDDRGMRTVMTESDIAFSSGGQILFELARAGVPVIAITASENQADNVAGWERTGFLESAGFWYERNLSAVILDKIKLMQDFKRRLLSSERGRRIVPMNGGEKIVEYIESVI